MRQALCASQLAFCDKLASEMNIDSRDASGSWFDQGVECEILKLGSSEWQKGRLKIRVSIEFCPDEPEESKELSEEGELSFPLDELRREEMHC
ncbi:KGK domain-containing protein [Thermoleptolyngbya oregonensis]